MMNGIKLWSAEERLGIQGWDFTPLAGRMAEEETGWSYRDAVLALMRKHPEAVLLDMGTGGGEFLLSLNPPPGRTYATEGYPPNYELCARLLPAYGIQVLPAGEDDELPFPDESFDLVFNRHESYSAREVRRVLKPGGVFVTQQVGGHNNRELAALLLGEAAPPHDAAFSLTPCVRALEAEGLICTAAEEEFPALRFYDIGALVRFARVIEWEFPGFTVERCFEPLCRLQRDLERQGFIESREHRFFIQAHKPPAE